LNPVDEFLQQQPFMVLDGALATELERHGANLDDPLWSAKCLIESPELIRKVHLDYLNAGADVIISASYQASLAGFQDKGFSYSESVKLVNESVRIAIEVRDLFWAIPDNRQGRVKPLVAASVGPYGACEHDGSEYHGNYQAEWSEVKEFHQQRLEILSQAGADVVAFETIPSMLEAELLIEQLEMFPEQYAWVSFSCRDGTQISHGELLSNCIESIQHHPQVVAIGINCTAPQFINPLLDSLPATACPLLVYPNSGETWLAQDAQWEGCESGGFSSKDWFKRGARLIGGCCRTGPDDIVQIRAELTRLTL
jgi:homocysteine S-methyltransferase